MALGFAFFRIQVGCVALLLADQIHDKSLIKNNKRDVYRTEYYYGI